MAGNFVISVGIWWLIDILGGDRGERFVGRLICRRRVYGIQFRVCTSCLRGRGLRELSGIVVSDLVLILRPRGSGISFFFISTSQDILPLSLVPSL